MECKWPECSQATKCNKCGKKLCHGHHDNGSVQIEGHFCYGENTFCIECWYKIKPKTEIFKKN